MLEKIKQAQLNGRILPDIEVDYDNVEINNPIEVALSLYPELIESLDSNKISCKVEIEGTENKRINTITYLEDFEYDYLIVRSSTHDGTVLFTLELFNKTIGDVISGMAYCTNNAPDNYSLDTFWDYNLEYIIGGMYCFKNYGLKDINGVEMYGMQEVIVMPVKVSYIKK